MRGGEGQVHEFGHKMQGRESMLQTFPWVDIRRGICSPTMEHTELYRLEKRKIRGAGGWEE